MEYRRLGNSGLKVSALGLGGGSFGGGCDARQTAAIVDRALELGINLVDTGDRYNDGRSEEYLGAAIRGRRHEVIIATKFGRLIPQGPWFGSSRREIMESVHGSLRRLGTDYVDLYQMHFWDATTPIDETLRALDDLLRRGDVLYVGCSNFLAWQVVEAQWVARNAGWTPLISAQNCYNLLDRRIEGELVPACRAHGVGIVAYYPLAGGFLAGTAAPDRPPAEASRLATARLGGRPLAQQVLSEENFARIANLDAFAQAQGHTLGELALSWLASKDYVSSILVGASTPEHVERNVGALDWQLAAEELEELG